MQSVLHFAKEKNPTATKNSKCVGSRREAGMTEARSPGYHLFMGRFNSDILHADAPHILCIERWYLTESTEDKVLNYEPTRAGIHHGGVKTRPVKGEQICGCVGEASGRGRGDYSTSVNCALNGTSY